MMLRDHPQLEYGGLPSWPPIWVDARKNVFRKLRGEVGDLVGSIPYGRTKLLLSINFDGEIFIGTLLLSDVDFCRQLHALLKNHIGHPIREIGDLDFSYTR